MDIRNPPASAETLRFSALRALCARHGWQFEWMTEAGYRLIGWLIGWKVGWSLVGWVLWYSYGEVRTYAHILFETIQTTVNPPRTSQKPIARFHPSVSEISDPNHTPETVRNPHRQTNKLYIQNPKEPKPQTTKTTIQNCIQKHQEQKKPSKRINVQSSLSPASARKARSGGALRALVAPSVQPSGRHRRRFPLRGGGLGSFWDFFFLLNKGWLLEKDLRTWMRHCFWKRCHVAEIIIIVVQLPWILCS